MTKPFLQIILIIALTSILSAGCSLMHSGDGKDENKGPDTLRVATLYGPLSYFNYRGEPMGIDYENVRRFAEEEGYILQISLAANINQLIEMIKSGEAQLAAYPVPYIAEYNSDIIHCGPKEISWQVLVQKEGKNKVTDVTELIGKEIFIEQNTKYQYRLENLNQELGGGLIIKAIENDTLDSEDLINMVEAGKIDFTVIDSEIARLNQKNFPSLDMTMKVSLDQAASWAVAVGNDSLAHVIDNWEKKYHDSPIVREIYKKYYDYGKGDIQIADLSYFKKRGIGPGNSSVPYENIFKKYAATSDYDWELLAAIAYCESGFDPNAVSRFGAMGLMQVMPMSAASVGIDPEFVSEPEANVMAAVKILMNIDKALRKKIPSEEERIKFVLASYNSGIGHIYDSMTIAEKHGLDPTKWTGNVSVGALMKSRPEYYNDPDVKHGYFRGRETVDFVEKVMTTYQYLK